MILFLISPSPLREKTLEVKDLSFLSIPYLSLQDAQDLSIRATTNGIEAIDSKEEDNHFDFGSKRVV